MTTGRRSIPQRDVAGTGFTPAMRRLAADVPGVQLVAFCDRDGEIIDYHSYFEPYDTKVAGALLGILLATIERECPRLIGAGLRDLLVRTDAHVLFVRPVTGGYYLAGVLAADTVIGKLYAALDAAHAMLATEAGL